MRGHTHERLLQSAAQIIQEDGLGKLSIDRLTEKAGLSRRSFFLHFKSKDHLLTEVLIRLRISHRQLLQGWLEMTAVNQTAEERVYSFFQRAIDRTERPQWRGCCFLRASVELADLPGHPAHAVIAEAYRDMAGLIESILYAGGYCDAARLADDLVIVLNGFLVKRLVLEAHPSAPAILRVVKVVLASGAKRDERAGSQLRRLAVY